MFYFYTNELHFTPEFLGRVRLAGSIASLAGAWVGGICGMLPAVFEEGPTSDKEGIAEMAF
jgi:hypothetical protein